MAGDYSPDRPVHTSHGFHLRQIRQNRAVDLDVYGGGPKTMSELHQKATSGFKWTGISSMATTALQIIQLLVLAHLLSPEDFGLMAMIMVIIGFMQSYSDLGISNAIIHYQKISRDQFSSLYCLNLFAGIYIFFSLIACTPVIIILYNGPQMAELTLWAAAIFLIIPWG